MKKPRIADFDPSAAERELGSPLDDMPLILKPHRRESDEFAGLHAKKQTSLPANQQAGMEVNLQTSIPVSKQTSLPANQQADKKVGIEKFSSYLRPDYRKELKRVALDEDKKDYEILEEAIAHYLQTRKPANK